MISTDEFIELLFKNNVSFFCGVPDSLLKSLNISINEKVNSNKHIITSNEGAAVGLGIGYYLATKKIPAVYMQNSGLGNAYNPLISLADIEVASIPILLLIGWRGEVVNNKQVSDEPQHIKQGQITLKTLNIMDIPHIVLDQNSNNLDKKISDILELALTEKRPVAIVFKKNTFNNKAKINLSSPKNLIRREKAIELIVRNSNKNSIFVSTTGMISRELYEIREQLDMSHDTDFLTVGGMGHASQIALGIANELPNHKVFCLDGDGAILMHMGGLAECSRVPNMIHVILNNGAHDSVGGQPTRGFDIDLSKIADGFGYKKFICVKDELSVTDEIRLANKYIGSYFLEIKCMRGNRDNLGRPSLKPSENALNLNKFIESIKYEQ